jgi:hypothetical protein
MSTIRPIAPGQRLAASLLVAGGFAAIAGVAASSDAGATERGTPITFIVLVCWAIGLALLSLTREGPLQRRAARLGLRSLAASALALAGALALLAWSLSVPAGLYLVWIPVFGLLAIAALAAVLGGGALAVGMSSAAGWWRAADGLLWLALVVAAAGLVTRPSTPWPLEVIAVILAVALILIGILTVRPPRPSADASAAIAAPDRPGDR